MGLDFITRCTPTFQRSWDQGRQQLVQQDLFTRHPQLRERTYRLSPENGNVVQVGQEVMLRFLDGQLLAFQGHTQVGVFISAPPALVQALQETTHGVACGRVERVHSRSKAADVTLL
jgi:hypothetical protein